MRYGISQPYAFTAIECEWTTIKAIWEINTLTAGITLGLFIILVVGYTRSPWRKLPPSPPRLPILGNALQLRDKTWLLSKDCKERFSEYTVNISE